MGLKILRFAALVMAALAMTMESAHVLELPQKMQYSPDLYSQVNGSLYRYFTVIRGGYQVTSIVLIVALVYFTFFRRPGSPTFFWTLGSAITSSLAFVVWLGVVLPVNRDINFVIRQRESVPDAWMQLRPQWEYGHAIGFALQLLGFCALVMSVLVDAPKLQRERTRSIPATAHSPSS